MAGRPLGKRHQDDVRAKIQASAIIGRLQKHIDGQAEMSSTQVRAAEILLKKSIPDLTATEMTGANGGPLQFTEIRRTIVDPKA